MSIDLDCSLFELIQKHNDIVVFLYNFTVFCIKLIDILLILPVRELIC